MKRALKKMIEAGNARIIEGGGGYPRFGVVKKAGGMEHKALREYFDSKPSKPEPEEPADENIQAFQAAPGDSEDTEEPTGWGSEDN